MKGTHVTQIWTKTNCYNVENQINQQIFDCLTQHEYTQTEHFRVWRRGDQTIVSCLVDDITSCTNKHELDLPYLYDNNTLVITDNVVNCPTLFSVHKIPDSFFGIYSYTPDDEVWGPDRDFSMAVNRIDRIRLWLFLDLAWRSRLDIGYVNFNCEDRYSNFAPSKAFEQCWVDHINTELQSRFANQYSLYKDQMPYRNYDIDFELIFYRSWLNIVVETYSYDNTVALSEKIFRALVTPAPWVVYSGRYTVAYLESLGFDCASDLIDHNHYDRLKELENKVRIFNWQSLEIVKNLKSLGVDRVRERYITAAEHNQQVLRNMKDKWPSEFDAWLKDFTNACLLRPN